MKQSQFVIGELYLCACGKCDAFTVTRSSNNVIEGITTTGIECVYTTEDFPKIRLATKLEKAMK